MSRGNNIIVGSAIAIPFSIAILLIESVIFKAIDVTDSSTQILVGVSIPGLITLSIIIGTVWRSRKDQKEIMDALTDEHPDGTRTNKLDRLKKLESMDTTLTEIRDELHQMNQNRAQNTS